MLFEPYVHVRFHIGTHSAYDMFSKYIKYIIVHLVIPNSVFGVAITF